MMGLIKKILRDEEGATMVEYALLLALIVGVLIGLWVTLGDKVKVSLQNVIDQIP